MTYQNIEPPLLYQLLLDILDWDTSLPIFWPIVYQVGGKHDQHDAYKRWVY
jgi:hypothetical protein